MHEWPTNLAEATAIQQRLRVLVETSDRFDQPRIVAGIDAGYQGDQARAAVVLLSLPDLTPLDWAVAHAPAPLPYIPGFLSFREGPAVLAALERLPHKPDLLIFDGQGIAHPRRFGIASHIGVLCDLPSIGCAKSLLVGKHAPLDLERGAWQPLYHQDEQIGAALRSRSNVRPVYVSVGLGVGLASALALVLACTTRYRLPEPTRLAHRLASHAVLPTTTNHHQ